MIKKSRKVIIAKYNGSKRCTVNLGIKKRNNIVVIYDAKHRRYIR